jgi:hypothetical protein
VDSYENDKQYWVYYILDKEKYAEQKAQKKQQIILKASNFISASFVDEQNNAFSSSLKKRIQAFSVLTPYLNEEINFDETKTNGVKNIFDLSALIQKQIQTISLKDASKVNVIKPFQALYTPVKYALVIKNSVALQNFPFQISSEDDRVKFNKSDITNSQGNLQIKPLEVEPINQNISITLSPDINALMGSDSVSKASINILKQFIQTDFLKITLSVSNINVFIQSVQKNLGQVIQSNSIQEIIQKKFSGQEINLLDSPQNADYIIESVADTQEDISSNTLANAYQLRLAKLTINLKLINQLNNGIAYTFQVKDVYGYGNSLDNAGLNAYQNSKLQIYLSETLFSLKRKVVVY